MKRCLPTDSASLSPCVAIHSESKDLKSLVAAAFLGLLFSLLTLSSHARQTTPQQDAAYLKVVTERAAKIVNTLGIADSAKYNIVLQTLVSQYAIINQTHEAGKRAVDSIKKGNFPGDTLTQKLKELDAVKQQRLAKSHNDFLNQLQQQLSEDQVEKVKDGMTYRILPVTYTAYLDMIPTLKAEEKNKIYEWLKEARELAMDAESSDAKHAVFGKYKGRINNYLSAQGYDLTKEREEWQKRLKAKSTTANKD